MLINPYIHSNITDFGRKEIDLRQELHELLYGSELEIGKGRVFIVREMRRDDDDHLVPCTCRDPLTGESPRNIKCNSCKGEGYLWDDNTYVGYKSEETPVKRYLGELIEIGDISSALPYVFFEYYAEVRKGDKLIEPKLDTEGRVLSPIQIEAIYSVPWARKIRGDSGRIEFVKLRVVEIEQ